jgi:3',5'-cyclic AMP phosphodiesterase CpdA
MNRILPLVLWCAAAACTATAEPPPAAPDPAKAGLGFDPPAFAELRDPPPGKPLRFLLFGDMHFGKSSSAADLTELSRGVRRILPTLGDVAFAVTLGDQVDNGADPRQWNALSRHEGMSELLAEFRRRGIPVFPLTGNHEVRPGGSRYKSSAERTLLDDAAEIERLAAASAPDPAAAAARIEAFRALRADLKKWGDSQKRADWGRWHELVFFEDVFRRNRERISHPPDPSEPLETWYAFRCGGCAFVVLDGNLLCRSEFRKLQTAGSPGQRQSAWLAKELAAARADGVAHIFLFTHQPPLVSDNAHADDARDVRSAATVGPDGPEHFADVVRRAKVSGWFSGHVHRYERFRWEFADGTAVPVCILGGSGPTRGKAALNPDPAALAKRLLGSRSSAEDRKSPGGDAKPDDDRKPADKPKGAPSDEPAVSGLLRAASELLRGPRDDYLAKPGQTVRQMFPADAEQQKAAGAAKLYFAVVTVDGPRVTFAVHVATAAEPKQPLLDSVGDLLGGK